MSTVGNWRGPNIIKDGLVFYFDAGSPNSYYSPSESVIWKDISGSGLTGTLINGAYYSSNVGGSFIFDGLDDYVDNIGTVSDFSFIQNTSIFSINFWFKVNNLNTDNSVLGTSITTVNKGFYAGFRYINALFGQNAFACYGFRGQLAKQVFNGATNDNIITDTNWHNACYTNNDELIGQWYVDGVSATTTSRYNPVSANAPDGIKSTGDSTYNLNVARPNGPSTYNPLGGSLSSLTIYNKALSAQEVLQNYNATKSIYGY